MCCRRLFGFLFVLVLCVSLTTTSFAMLPVEFTDEAALDESDFYDFDSVISIETLVDLLAPDEASFDDFKPFALSDPTAVIGHEPPSDLLFYGSGWVTGRDSQLGDITVYFPISYQDGYWGLDSNGYLINVSSSSITGYLPGVYNNSVSASGFSYPRYRETNNANYTTLYLKPTNSNMNIATANAPRYSADDLIPYGLLFVGGVLVLCYMKRS